MVGAAHSERELETPPGPPAGGQMNTHRVPVSWNITEP